MASTPTPAGPPPTGITSHFIDPPDTLHLSTVATTVTAIVVTTIFVVARSIARWSIGGARLDDYLLAVAWALNVAYNGVLLWQDHAGVGRHIWDITALDAVEIARQGWIAEIIYCFVIWSAKSALIFQLKRIFAPTGHGATHMACLILFWLNLGFYFAILFAGAFQCVPVEKIWNPFILTGHCVDRSAELITAGVFNIVTDVCLFVLPLWAILRLNMVIKHKIGIGAVFATGILAIAASVGRTVYTVQLLGTTDGTYVIVQVALWTVAELVAIILCTCFPLMPHFFKLLLGESHATTETSCRLSNRIGTHNSRKSAWQVTESSNCGSGSYSKDHIELKNNPQWHMLESHDDTSMQCGIQRTIDITLQSQSTEATEIKQGF